MVYQRSIPFLVPFSVWLLCQLFLWRSDFVLITVFLGVLLITFGTKYTLSVNRIDWPLFLITPLLLFLSLLSYAAIVINRSFIQIIFLTILFLLFFFFRSLYYHSLNIERRSGSLYPSHLEETVFVAGNLSVFTGAAFLFSLPVFLNLSAFSLLAMLSIVIILAYLQHAMGFGWSWSAVYRIFLINTLITIEFAIIIYLLPLNFDILAVFLMVLYFLGITVVNLFAQNNFNRHSFRAPLTLGVIVITVLLFSSRWL